VNLLVGLAIFVLMLGAVKAFAATPISNSSPFIEVTYETVGWFYGSDSENTGGYNYTYLVLNVTIANDGYSQVNPDQGQFSVAISGNSYSAEGSILGLPYIYNYSSQIFGYTAYELGLSDFPSVTLLNGGVISGTIAFQFGNPNDVPQPPQIWNAPFSLTYSVTYGDSIPYLPATVQIVPEFQTFLILPFFLIATLAAIALNKKKAVLPS